MLHVFNGRNSIFKKDLVLTGPSTGVMKIHASPTDIPGDPRWLTKIYMDPKLTAHPNRNTTKKTSPPNSPLTRLFIENERNYLIQNIIVFVRL